MLFYQSGVPSGKRVGEGAGIWPVEGARATYSRELKKEGTRRRVGSWKQESGRGRCHKGWDFRSGVDGFGGRSELDRPKR